MMANLLLVAMLLNSALLGINPLRDNPVIGKRASEGIAQDIKTEAILTEINNRTVRYIRPNDLYPDGTSLGTEDAFSVFYLEPGVSQGGMGGNMHVPDKWAGKQLKFTIFWMPEDTQTGNVVWTIEMNQISDTSYTAEVLNFPIVPIGTSNRLSKVSVDTTSFVLKEDDIISFSLRRDGDDALDTAPNALFFLMLKIEEI